MAPDRLVVTRPSLPAADRRNDSLFVARAALQRAVAVRAAANLQVDQLRALVDHLEAERRAESGT
jgi:DNA-binding GntR family transcriptional regulator